MEKLYRLHQKHFGKWLVGGCIPLILAPAGADPGGGGVGDAFPPTAIFNSALDE